jgi:hypothetical protein
LDVDSPAVGNGFRLDVLLVGIAAVGAATFLYNKQLNVEAAKERRIAEAALYERQKQ